MALQNAGETEVPSLVPDIRQHEAELLADIEQAKKEAEAEIEKAKSGARARLEEAKKAVPETITRLENEGQPEIQQFIEQELDHEKQKMDQIVASARVNMDQAVDCIVRTVVPGAAQ